MNLLKEYRAMKGLTQIQLAEELRDVEPAIDNALISKMESGVCSPSYAVTAYLISGFANRVSEEKTSESINVSTDNISDLKMSIYADDVLGMLMGRTIDNPISRGELASRTGYSDRTIRKAILELRENGFRVISSSYTTGYWLAQTPEEYRILRNDYLARLKSLARTIHAMDAAIPGQIAIGDADGR